MWSDNGFVEVAEHVVDHTYVNILKVLPKFLFALFSFSFICLLKFKY